MTQEVFAKVLRDPATSARVAAWGPWLNRVTVNACRDRRSSAWWRLWRSEPREFLESDFADAGPTPEEAALGHEKRRAIWTAFRGLPSRQREVFALRFLEGCSTEDTAEALGLSTGTVKQHLFRAVRRLRSALGGAA